MTEEPNAIQRLLVLVLLLGALCNACFDPQDPVPAETDSEGSSTAGTDQPTDDADDTMEGSTSIGRTETGTTGPDGCPPAVFDVSRFDEACFQ